MPSIQRRLPQVALGIVALAGLLFLLWLVPAAADNASGSISLGFFGDNTAVTDPTNQVGWDWKAAGGNARVELFLGAAFSGAVYGIEVFVDPDTSTAPTFKDLRPVALPTGQVLPFDFREPKPMQKGVTYVGIHLLNSAGSPILVSAGYRNTGLLVPPPTPTPAPAPAAPPVVTVVVPPEQVKPVAAPTGGAAVVLQPTLPGSLVSPDKRVSVAVPPLASDKTFQLAYNPSPTNVPAASPGTKHLRTFDLSTFDAAGTRVSLDLLKPITIGILYTAEDVAAAPGKNPSNLKIQTYDTDVKAWVSLNTTVDLVQQTLQASVSHLSLFSVATEEPPPQVVATATPTPPVVAPTPTPTARPPVTGDIAPDSGLMLALLLAGFLLLTAGGTYLVQLGRRRS
ncbi:MAG: hypothetical protein HY535_04520 [Chloroflexi bacterium]|nr:hypothetical protein [Chloroflexota bacterium]